ncbi:MAG: type-F conjugative transfer system pilin assembly protein TrbC [Betaproteobacteria bacterium]
MSAPGDPRAQRRPIACIQQAACLAASSVIALLALDAFAQERPTAPRWPTAQEIERTKAERPLPAPDATIPAPRALPRIAPGLGAEPGRAPVTGTGIDIGALARQGGQIGGAIGPGALPPQEPALRIFVTLDMPQGSLRRLVDQAERSGAVLVLRGLKNQSMRQTVAAVSELLGEREAGWVIDPEAFERHGVEAAPTFLLTTGEDAPSCNATTCTVPRPFISVSGDVSLDYALEHMVRRHPGAAAVAGPYLSRLRPR